MCSLTILEATGTLEERKKQKEEPMGTGKFLIREKTHKLLGYYIPIKYFNSGQFSF